MGAEALHRSANILKRPAAAWHHASFYFHFRHFRSPLRAGHSKLGAFIPCEDHPCRPSRLPFLLLLSSPGSTPASPLSTCSSTPFTGPGRAASSPWTPSRTTPPSTISTSPPSRLIFPPCMPRPKIRPSANTYSST